MIEGFSAAASALSAQQQRMDALANDTANVNTAGYRSDRTAFADLVAPAQGVRATQLGPSTVQGAEFDTGQPLDLAIEGDGWFQVARPGGAQPALARVGIFQVDATGQMVTQSGERLVPPVQLPPGAGATSVRIAPDGSVIVGGNQVARIRLVTVPAPGQLEPIGDGLYAPNAASGPPQPASNAAIRQGAVEGSDVDLADTTVGTIEARTSFEAAAQVLHVQDEMLGALLDLRSNG
jgi:flagellar basal-body rod protein FlgG